MGSREFAPQVFLQIASLKERLRPSGASAGPYAACAIGLTLCALTGDSMRPSKSGLPQVMRSFTGVATGPGHDDEGGFDLGSKIQPRNLAFC